MPRGKAIWNANGGFVSVLLTHLLWFTIQYNTNKFITRLTCQFASESRALYRYFKEKLPPPTKLKIFFRVCVLVRQWDYSTRGESNLTKSASRGAHSPVRGHPRGSKVVPFNHWGRVSY